MSRTIAPTIISDILDIEKMADAEKFIKVGSIYHNENIENLLISINDIRNALLKEKFKHLHHRLSKRELEIINHICGGKTTLEIAKILNLSKHTVESHRTNIFSKLDVRNSIELVALAFKVGIINPNECLD
jgi:DNA-binding CsgD family transcriptional regulator